MREGKGERERDRERHRERERERESERMRKREEERQREVRDKQYNTRLTVLTEEKHSYNKGIYVRVYLRLSYRMLVAQCQR